MRKGINILGGIRTMKIKTKKFIGLTVIYTMFCITFGTGAILIEANDLHEAKASTNESPVNSETLYTTSMFQGEDLYQLTDREETLEEIQERLKPVMKNVFVKIKDDGVESLNIRQEPTKDSSAVSILYPGELIEGTVAYVADQLKEEEWIKVKTGYVHSHFVDIIEEDIDITLYRETPKQTLTKNPILTPDVSEKSYLSVEDLKKATEGTELEGIETAVVSAEENFGINGLFIYAVARLESGHGTSQIARDKNNLFGMNAQDHDPYNLAFEYDSFHDSVYDFATRIKNYYVDRGMETVDEINSRYSSDPEWHSKVYSIMTNTYQSIIN